jgi:hypothetical protein
MTASVCSIRVGDRVLFKTSDVRLVVIEVVLDGRAAWCEIEEGKGAGLLVVAKVRDLVKISSLN